MSPLSEVEFVLDRLLFNKCTQKTLSEKPTFGVTAAVAEPTTARAKEIVAAAKKLAAALSTIDSTVAPDPEKYHSSLCRILATSVHELRERIAVLEKAIHEIKSIASDNTLNRDTGRSANTVAIAMSGRNWPRHAHRAAGGSSYRRGVIPRSRRRMVELTVLVRTLFVMASFWLVVATGLYVQTGTEPLNDDESATKTTVYRSALSALASVNKPQDAIEPATNEPLADNKSVNMQSDASDSIEVPIPINYGIYASNHGKLTSLQTLPIRIPDQRVGISALIAVPSVNTFLDGQLQFVVFRRELADDALDSVTVRVVARLVRALTFSPNGVAKAVTVKGTWAVRSNAYEMQVTPLGSNMFLVKPKDPGFSFPPGRYVLVLKNSGYDFSVAGQIVDTAQCLERTDAVNMPTYSECRQSDLYADSIKPFGGADLLAPVFSKPIKRTYAVSPLP